MRSPINQGGINSPASVNAWAEASVREVRAEAFGVGVRVVPMRGTVQVSASSTAIGERTAYQFASASAHASVGLTATRYAWAPAPAREVRAQSGIVVIRYARVMVVPGINEAESFDDPIKIVAYSVAIPRAARGVSLVWNNDNKTQKIRVRIQYIRGSRVGRSEIRILPNAIIGVGRTLGECESTLTGVSHIQSARGSAVARAEGQTTLLSRIRPGVSESVGTASFGLEPTLQHPGNPLRYSYNSAFPEGTAASGAVSKRTTPGLPVAALGEIGFSGEARRNQKIRGSTTGRVNLSLQYWSYHIHRLNQRLQVSAFMLFGPAFYHLQWVEGVARPEGVSQLTGRHLRWVGVTGIGQSRGNSSAVNRVMANGRGIANVRATFPGSSWVRRRMFGTGSTRANSQGNYVRERLVFAEVIGEAPYPPDGEIYATRWANHGASEGVDAFAESLGIGLRIVRHRANIRVARAEGEITGVRNVTFTGLSGKEGIAASVKEARKLAGFWGTTEGRGFLQSPSNRVVIYHVVWASFNLH